MEWGTLAPALFLGVPSGVVVGALVAWLLLQMAERRLSTTFKSLAADALRGSTESLLVLANDKFGGMVKPVEESLRQLDQQIQEIEKTRVGAYEKLITQVAALEQLGLRLQTETGRLTGALRAPAVQGQWGELMLKRVAELGGMLEHCDFDIQKRVSVDGRYIQPDMIIYLAGGRIIVVDAKCPMESFLQALNCSDEGQRRKLMADYIQNVRNHIKNLSEKEYWAQFERNRNLERIPEFVILFLPSEGQYRAALEADPGLLEYGLKEKIIIASPVTLIALLKAVAYGWREEQLERHAQEIKQIGQNLYSSMIVFNRNIINLSGNLRRTVDTFNDLVGFYERRALPAVRRLKELGAGSEEEMKAVLPVDEVPRTVTVREGDTIGAEGEEYGNGR